MNTDKIYAEQLANEYALKDNSKVVALRKLDKKAKLPATVFTYTFGIIAALIAGVGMCLSMKVIGNGSSVMFVLGVIVGIIGLLGMGVNRPTFYLHYETMADLLSESVSHMNEQFLAHMKKDTDAFVTKMRDCPLDELRML